MINKFRTALQLSAKKYMYWKASPSHTLNSDMALISAEYIVGPKTGLQTL